ncbi:hypothetical protein LV84_03404 [Algoriphagus ratkowskyi]|uniref:Uncharacterized protein n=1 Tax=Algoriphagus ratkowskyi TaxID=57028 RepID=A0A2W7QWZ5_9BACT|nr:hypothetical protein LV84_03404 [Algoriphagus ratkowskyi]
MPRAFCESFIYHLPAIEMAGYNIDHAYGIIPEIFLPTVLLLQHFTTFIPFQSQ